MRYQDAYKLAKNYYPAIRLEDLFPQRLRGLLWSLGIFVFILTSLALLAEWGLSSFDWKDNAEQASLALSQIKPFLPVAQSLWSVSLAILLALFAVGAMFKSFFYKGIEDYLKEQKPDKPSASFEVAHIIYKNKGSILESFFKSKWGREIVIRLGLEATFLRDVISQSHLDDQTITFPKKITLTSLAATLTKHEPVISELLFKHGLSAEEFNATAAWVEIMLIKRKRKRRGWSRENLSRVPGMAKDWSYGFTRELEKFSRPIYDFPEYAQVNLDNPRGEQETKTLETVLSRGREANAIIVGAEGAGKLEILARLGHMIEDGVALPQIEHKIIVVLEGDAIVAQSQDKVTFERYFMQLLNEAARAGNVLLGINNFPAFVTSAKHLGSDVLSLMDPYLASSQMQVIGLADSDSFYGHLEQHPKINQRFDVVNIKDADEDSTLVILKDYAENQERRHGVIFAYPALAMIVTAANRYITQGVMPDKAIDLLMQMPAHAQQLGKKIITKKDVTDVVETKTGIPIGEVKGNESAKLLELENFIHKRVVGQHEAVVGIADTMRRSRSGIQNPKRPMGSFLFLGPTGVGKTEVSKALAEQFFGDEETMTRFDMSEYKTADALDKLIGSFQTGQSGTLVNALKQKPYGLLLLDELEKSTDQVKDLFLQVLDEGMFADMRGKRINARNNIVIATSNAGADVIWEYFQKGINPSQHKAELVNMIIQKGLFKPELINRFDNVIVFNPLDPESLQKISRLMLQKLQRRIYDQKRIQLKFSSDVIEYVAKQGSDPQFGARPMNRFIQDTIEQLIARKILSGEVHVGQELPITKADLVSLS